MTESKCIDHGLAGNKHGYAQRSIKGVRALAHRWAYCIANGVELDSIAGKVVRHKCDNPRCVNPEHLVIGTVQDNVADRVERGRNGLRYKGETNCNAVLTPDDIRAIRRRKGERGLAKEYGVSRMTISLIQRRERWAHIE